MSPRQILRQQRLAAEHDAGVGREQVQQPELLIGELDVAARRSARGGAARSISMPWMRTGGPALSSSPSGDAAAARLARPAQQRARARDQLAHAERLGQVVVGAALEADHLVRLLAPRGQHQDRHVAVHACRCGRRGTATRRRGPGSITSSTSRSKRSASVRSSACLAVARRPRRRSLRARDAGTPARGCSARLRRPARASASVTVFSPSVHCPVTGRTVTIY